PLGLAAGFDKDATAFDALACLGFGFVEVGTVTAVAQPGNPRPRVFRYPEARALVNRMGFPNGGAKAAAARLARRQAGDVVGVNVAPDLGNEEIDALADLALELSLDGIVAVNTTILAGDEPPWRQSGGLSGAPLRPRALEVLERLRRRAGDRLLLISVGGVESA